MKKNRQLVVDKEKGDCFRACLTSILEIPNDKKLPNCDDASWLTKWMQLLYPYGLSLAFEAKACWRSGYWIASVKSKNYKDTTHAVVMFQSKVAFDPSTKKKYKIGESLLGKEVVSGGYYLEVLNPAKRKSRRKKNPPLAASWDLNGQLATSSELLLFRTGTL